MVFCRIGAAGSLEASAWSCLHPGGEGVISFSFSFVPWGFKASAYRAGSSVVFLLPARPANQTLLADRWSPIQMQMPP